MLNFRKRLKAAASLVLLGAVVMFPNNLRAASTFVLPQNPRPAPSTVQTGNTNTTLTPVQPSATNSVLPTNIFSGQLDFTNGVSSISAGVFTVPAGKRLVIEFVSAIADLGPSQILLSVSIDGLQVVPQFTGNQLDGSPVFVVSQPLRDVLAAGQTLVVAAGRSSPSGVADIFVNVIGELEDAP